jgi:group I intron endonuclease
MKVTKGVYVLTNKINGKKYVGIGMGKNGVEGRWCQYRNYNCKKQIKLYRALKLYGVENFSFEVILETDDIDNAKRSEMYLIDVWNLQEDGYNISAGGDCGMLGIKASEETRKKMSVSQQGRQHSEETKKKIGDAQKGEKHHGFGKKRPNHGQYIAGDKNPMKNLNVIEKVSGNNHWSRNPKNRRICEHC